MGNDGSSYSNFPSLYIGEGVFPLALVVMFHIIIRHFKIQLF